MIHLQIILRWLWFPLLLLLAMEILSIPNIRRQKFFSSIDLRGHDGKLPQYLGQRTINTYLKRFRFKSKIPLEKWEKAKSEIEMFYRKKVYKMEQSKKDIRTVDLYMIQEKLPNYIEWQDGFMEPGDKFAIGEGYMGKVVWDDLDAWVNFGEKDPITIDISPRANSHILLCGMSGSGKSYQEHQLLYRLILAEQERGEEYFFADYKGDDTFSYLKSCPRYYSYKDTLEALNIVHARLIARQSGEDTSRNPVTLIWDEYMAQALNLMSEDNIKDTARLYEDYRRFWQRFKYYLSKQGHPPAEYIIAAEPQGRGAWHLHCLFLFPSKAPFIPNADMVKIWGQGFTKTQSLKGVGNPGLYLTAYLGNMELTEAIHSGTFRAGQLAESKDRRKAVVKGARLKLYPPGFNLYRYSRGVKRPEVWQTTEWDAQAKVKGLPLTYEKTIAVTDESGTVLNIINYRTYTKPPAKDGSGTPDSKQEEAKEAERFRGANKIRPPTRAGHL